MHPGVAEWFGIAAAAASLYAANSKTIIPLRIAAMVANALALIYSFLHGTYPTFALNAVLLPLNAWRLHAMVARRQRGALLGGDHGRALVSAAETWMLGQAIASPARFAELLAPGC